MLTARQRRKNLHMIGITLPIVLLDDHGPTTDKVAGRPCIEIGFTTDQLPEGDPDPAKFKRTYGMIDTGADHVAIGHDLVGAVTHLPTRPYLLTGANGTTVSSIYRGTLLFFGASITLRQETEFVLLPPSSSVCKVLLGRTFLQHTRFRYEGQHGIERLEISPTGGI